MSRVRSNLCLGAPKPAWLMYAARARETRIHFVAHTDFNVVVQHWLWYTVQGIVNFTLLIARGVNHMQSTDQCV